MERYTMFLDWKNQHCENDYTTQSNIQIQPIKISSDIFHRTGKKFHNFYGNAKDPKCPKNIEKEKQRWRNQAPRIQIILQTNRNQDSMVQAQKQKYRSMVQDRKPRDKPTHIWSPNL